MDPIEEFAKEVVDRAEDYHDMDSTVKFDPITLMILFTVVSAVLGHYVKKWLDNCDHKAIRFPSAFQRWRLRRALYLELSRSDRPELAHVAVKPVERAILLSLSLRDEQQIGTTLAAFRRHLGKES